MQGFIDFIVIQANFDYVVIVLYLKLSKKLKKLGKIHIVNGTKYSRVS